MKKRIVMLAIAALPTIFTSCSNDDNNKSSKEKEVMENYANLVTQNYTDAYNDADKMEVALKAFTDNPSEETLENAKKVWKEARETYGTTEAFRFAGGPIDDEDGPEGLLNAWPLDEHYIDYVVDPNNPGSLLTDKSIIYNTTDYPEITEEVLEGLNEVGGEENVSVGYHAIEFLLWGQDNTSPSQNMPGQRSYTDFIQGSSVKQQHAERRKKYLLICAKLIKGHLNALIKQWEAGGSYRAIFMAMNEKQALTNMFTGIATLSKAELAGERMHVALSNKSQEDEHSCFSDNTHRDIRANFYGIVNVYEGKYGSSIKGESLADLVKDKNANLAKEVGEAITKAKNAVEATGVPFDIAISGGKDTPEGQKVLAAVLALQDLGDKFAEAGKALGLTVSTTVEE